MPRFVILDHDHPKPHFDLMIESTGRLRAWRLLGDPQSLTPVLAEPIGDHHMKYLDYEGPVSGHRGRVIRWDSGVGEIVEESIGSVLIEIEGSRCRGTGELRQADGSWTWRWTQLRD